MADTAGGNPGMNKLARVLQQRIKETLEYRIGDVESDFGTIRRAFAALRGQLGLHFQCWRVRREPELPSD